jgi:hypothetical protein
VERVGVDLDLGRVVGRLERATRVSFAVGCCIVSLLATPKYLP